MSAQFIYPSHPTLRKLCWTAFTSGGLRELALRTDELHLTFATLDQAQRFSARAASDFGDTKTVIKPPTPTWGNRFRVTVPCRLNTSRPPRAAGYTYPVGDVRQFNRLMFQTGFRNF